MNPVGPEEPSVYWRRRAVVGVGLLVALLILWWLFSSVFGSDGDAGDQQTPQGTVSSAPPTPAASPAPTSPTPTAQAPASATAKAQAPAAKKAPRCPDAAIAVVVTPAARNTEVGDGMKLTMAVTNTGSEACRRDVSLANNEIRVVSGRVLVWSSNYCKGTEDGPSVKEGTVTLSPDESWKTTVKWPGKVTAATCPEDQPTAKAGTYRTLGSNGDRRSAEATFTLG